MVYRHVLFDSILDVNPAEWNALRMPSDPFMDSRFVLAVEKAFKGSGRFWHVLFYDEQNQPAASACLCLYKVDGALLADGTAAVVAGWVKRIAPWAMYFKVLFCGLPVSAGQSSLRFAPGVDSASILKQLDEVMLKIARRERAKCIVMKEFEAEECERLGVLPELGLRRADSLPMNHTSLKCKDFDDFLKQMPSRKRYPIKRSQKKMAKTNLRVVQKTGGEGVAELYTDEVHKLYENVLNKAEVKLEKLPPEFFRELARNMPDESAFTFIYDGDQIVAFAASLYNKTEFHQMFVGVDYSRNNDVDLYFNLFFHALDYAFRQDVADIYVGQSADTFKQRKLGCHQRPMYFFVKGVDVLTKFVLRQAFDSFFPPHPHRADVPDDDEEGETEKAEAGKPAQGKASTDSKTT